MKRKGYSVFGEVRVEYTSPSWGHISQVMAALRNTVIGLMRWSGQTNIAAACRRFAARPWDALDLSASLWKTE